MNAVRLHEDRQYSKNYFKQNEMETKEFEKNLYQKDSANNRNL